MKVLNYFFENNNLYQALKTISLLVLCSFYIVAGFNHFLDPKVYYDLIPPYFSNRSLINSMSGAFEIIAGILMIFPITRKLAAYLIIAILISFIPAHIYLIQMKGCVSKKICVAEWIAWIRLFPLQFILMWWGWKTYKWNK